MIDNGQLREHVIRPVLKYLDPVIPYSLTAENLLMGTCAQESKMGTYLVQLGDGPALSIFQMEPATHDDIWDNFLLYNPEIANKIACLSSTNNASHAVELIGNLSYAAAMVRVHYFRRPESLPYGNGVPGLASYWKCHYNTECGKGTEEEFIRNYGALVS